VGTNCGWGEFIACFKEWEVGNESLLEESMEKMGVVDDGIAL